MVGEKIIEDFRLQKIDETKTISTFSFASLIDIFKRTMSSTTGLNIFAIIARVQKYKSIIKKKKKKHNEITLLAKTNLNSIKGLISRSLTDSSTRHNFLFVKIISRYERRNQ